MTPPWIVVYATNRPFRVRCDAVLRALGARVRLASRQAELVKAIGAGTTAAIIVSDDGRDAEVAREANARAESCSAARTMLTRCSRRQ